MSTAQIWTGASATIPQGDLVTINSATSTDTYSFATGTGKTVTYTAGGSDTTATIAAGLFALCNASTEPDFTEITFAYVSGATFTATGPADGAPMANAVGGTGSSTLTTPTAAVSPHDYSLAANWLSGTAPGSGDSVTFDGAYSTIPCKYNLGYADTTSLSSWKRLATFAGQGTMIGLPAWNPAGYEEFRQTYCQVDSTSITIQQADSDATPCIKVQGTNASATTATIIGVGQGGFGGFSGSTPTDYTIEIFGLPASSIVHGVNANIGIAVEAGQTCTVATLLLNNCTGLVGTGVTLTTPTVNGGSVQINCSYTTLTINSGATVVVGGAATPGTSIIINSGTCQWQSTGALSATTIGSLGTLDMSVAPAVVAVGTITLLPGGTLNDPNQRLTRSFTISATSAQMSQVNLNLGTGFTAAIT